MKTNKGFTLVEMMIVLAIIGVLSAIAYPSYINQMMKSRRTDAMGVLNICVNQLEKFHLANRTYVGAAGTDDSPSTLGTPRICAPTSPDTTQFDADADITVYYDVSITEATATAFTISAVPRSGLPQADDFCTSGDSVATTSTLTVNSLGVKTPSECWAK